MIRSRIFFQLFSRTFQVVFKRPRPRKNVNKIFLYFQPHVVSGKDKSGKSAAHYCAENQNLNCIEQIIAADPGLLNEVDEEGYAPLHLAVISGNSLIVKFLISKGADVNALDNEKHSTVHWATGKFCLKYHELKTTVRPMVKTVGLGKLGDKLYRSSKEIPKMQSETIAAPAMQSPLGI